MPVHRHLHDKQGSVFAYRAELDAWWQNGHARVTGDSAQAIPLRRKQALPVTLGVTCLVIVAVVAFLIRVHQARQAKPDDPGRFDSVVVLPFENLTGEPTQDYFADGITDQLIMKLGMIGRLRVISRTSAMAYKGAHKPLPQIARELRVNNVVEGSVARSGNRVRIDVRLVEATTDRHLWTQSYDRDLRDVLALQDDVARAIAKEIQVKLTPREERELRGTRAVNPEAFEFYLKGRYFWNKRDQESLERAVDYFARAAEKEPSYALPYTGLADSYSLLAVWESIRPREGFPKAKAAAKKALDLDRDLAEAHTSLAFVTYRFDWDWSGAEREFQQAINLNPNYATGHQWYGEFLVDMGRFEQGIAEFKEAQQLDPLSPIISSDLGMALIYAERYDSAILELEKVLEMDPNFLPALNYLGAAYERKREFPNAIAAYKKALALSPVAGGAQARAGLAKSYAKSGNKIQAERILRELRDLARKGPLSPFQAAAVYASLGEKDQALAWLDKAYDEHSWWMVVLKVQPEFDSFRSDPRFQELVRKVGLPQ